MSRLLVLIHYIPQTLRRLARPVLFEELPDALDAGAVKNRELETALNLLGLHSQVRLEFVPLNRGKFARSYTLAPSYNPQVVAGLTDHTRGRK